MPIYIIYRKYRIEAANPTQAANAWQQSGRFAEAIRRNPQAAQAVSYFTNYYLLLPRSEQRRIAETFLDQVYPVIQDPILRAVFAEASTPGIVWEEVEANPQLVFINGKGITDPASRSFAMQWVWDYLLSHLKGRGRRQTPFVVTIDEFANLVNTGTADNKHLAELFDELFAQYARTNRIFVTLALQSLDQVDERLQRTLLRLRTLITGRAGSPTEARLIGDHLFRKDIYRIHHYKKVFGKVDPVPLIRGVGYQPPESLSQDKLSSPYYPYYILENEPQYMGLDLQAEDAAGRIQQLGALEFLCRPAVSEGAVSQDVVSLALSDAITDPDTGEGIFPDPEQDAALIAQIQHGLAARSGIPISDILSDQDARLTQGTPQNPQQTQPDTEVSERHLPQLTDGTQPEPRSVRETQSRPTLDEQQIALLAFLMTNPDVPIANVYKQLQLSGRKGSAVRESLNQLGLLSELEVRTGRIGAGRPTKFVTPTIAAFELLGKDPPPGRGGVIHRAIQHMVQESALAKDYHVQREKDLGNGGIVDVHLEKGTHRIAVEIAIASKPEREIAHIKHCLSFGYDQVYGIFADEHLLLRTQRLMQETFSREEAGKVRLLPLRQLSLLG
jgi:hypothetical protein